MAYHYNDRLQEEQPLRIPAVAVTVTGLTVLQGGASTHGTGVYCVPGMYHDGGTI